MIVCEQCGKQLGQAGGRKNWELLDTGEKVCIPCFLEIMDELEG